MMFVYDTVLLVSAFLLSFLGTMLAYALLKNSKILDIPNERSNHVNPTPRGGGVAIILTVACFFGVLGVHHHIIVPTLFLCALSLVDDVKPLPVSTRIYAQILAVLYAFTGYEGRVFAEWFPWWLELPVVGLVWVWLINVFNFMDGADGVASSEAISVCVGVALLVHSIAIPDYYQLDSMVMAGAVLGFGLWNWHPAKIFMGDAGSIPLGFLIGYLLLVVASHGYWAAALILPAYFFADATFVLVRRILRKEPFWQAHSSHFYQKAIRRGMTHEAVAQWIIALNMVLIGLAVMSTLGHIASYICLALAYGLSTLLMARFSNPPTQVELLEDLRS